MSQAKGRNMLRRLSGTSLTWAQIPFQEDLQHGWSIAQQ